MCINLYFSSRFIQALFENERGQIYYQGWHLNSLRLFSGISFVFVGRIYVEIENCTALQLPAFDPSMCQMKIDNLLPQRLSANLDFCFGFSDYLLCLRYSSIPVSGNSSKQQMKLNFLGRFQDT